MGRGKALHRAVRRAQRLPPVRVVQGVRAVDGLVSGIIGVRLAVVEVAELVRAVRVPEREDRCARDIADASRRAHVVGRIGRVVAEARQQRVEELSSLRGEEIDQRPIRRDRHGVRLVVPRALRGRAPESPSQARPDRLRCVRSPCIVHAGVHDGERACGMHRRKRGVADGLEQRRVPLQDDVVAAGGRASRRRPFRRRREQQ